MRKNLLPHCLLLLLPGALLPATVPAQSRALPAAVEQQYQPQLQAMAELFAQQEQLANLATQPTAAQHYPMIADGMAAIYNSRLPQRDSVFAMYFLPCTPGARTIYFVQLGDVRQYQFSYQWAATAAGYANSYHWRFSVSPAGHVAITDSWQKITAPGAMLPEPGNCQGTQHAAKEASQMPAGTLHVYPNPAFGRIYIEAEAPQQLSVFSLTGAQQLQPQTATALDVGMLPAGTYLLQATNPSGEVRYSRFVKQ